jgi:2-polyprenyl-3-methyl-5-hydroxy-6-metoxy-1,4-benzoquinol methylase
MAQNPYLTARSSAVTDPQERNRVWWESLPMTYEGWGNADRSTTREKVTAAFLAANPWLGPQHFASYANQDVLEIGCGAGPATCLFAASGARVTAIDLTEAAVEMTKRHVEGMPVTVRRMDAEQLTFPDAAFDHVFSWGVLHHSANTAVAFAEVVRVLRPGGTALIMVYNRASLRYWLKGMIWLLLRGHIMRGDTLTTVQRFYTDGYYHRHFTPRELTRALAGIEVTRVSLTHMAKKMIPGVPTWLDEILKRRYGWLLIAECAKNGGVTLPH